MTDATVLPQSRRPDGTLLGRARMITLLPHERALWPLKYLTAAAKHSVLFLGAHTCMLSLTQTQVRVKKAYVPPEEQKAFRRATVAGPAGLVAGGGRRPVVECAEVPRIPRSTNSRKAKRAEGGEGLRPPSPSRVDERGRRETR